MLNYYQLRFLGSGVQVYNHFNMPQEMAILLKERACKSVERWVGYNDPEHSEEVLESMRLYVEAAEAYANISAGMQTSRRTQ